MGRPPRKPVQVRRCRRSSAMVPVCSSAEEPRLITAQLSPRMPVLVARAGSFSARYGRPFSSHKARDLPTQ
eukprot:scaffold2161_cov225-Prasinococcus_capsulatus_cf.AAC.5